MIKDFRDSWLWDFYLDDKATRKIPATIRHRLFRKLQLLDDATCSQDLRSPPGNHFERLSGNLAGRHSIRVSDQWRLVFSWNDGHGEATGLYLDNHDYR